jgi:hypothetical protein
LAWSDCENDLIVADYFAMLRMELRGEAYVKAHRRRALLPLLDGRSESSIEFKHQNISAVLLGLGEPWIEGYKPAANFQDSLVDAVLRALGAQSGWTLDHMRSQGAMRMREDALSGFWFGPPPTLSNAAAPITPADLAAVSRRVDVAARDAENRALGEAGEAFIFDLERMRLRDAGKRHLADRVRWVSRDEGDGAGFDIASFDERGRERLIEVKTTNGWERTPFHVTRNELAVADAHRNTWVLARLHDFARSPRGFELRPPLQNHVALTPTTFLASLI